MGFFLFLVVVGVVVYTWLKNSKTAQLQWEAAAERLGLGYYAGDLGMIGKISGRKGGHRVVISTFTKGSGNSSRSYTKYRVDYHERIRVDFKITRQTSLHRLGQVFGMEDIEVGNPAFDDLAAVRGMHPEMVRKFLVPDRQQAVMRLLGAYKDVVITNEHIEVNKPGKDGDSAVIAHTARALLSVCNDLTDTSPDVAAEGRAIEIEEPPPLSGFEPDEAVEIEPTEPSFDPYTSANPLVPDPPEIVVGELDDPAPQTMPPAAEPVQTPAGPPVLELNPVAGELFGGSVGSSLLATRVFDDRFKGKTVAGSGVLKRVGKFSYDPVFSNATGVKATMDICELAGPYSKIKVTAEVKYQTAAYGSLKAKVGQTLPIAGTLIAHDAMLNQLYIADD